MSRRYVLLTAVLCLVARAQNETPARDKLLAERLFNAIQADARWEQFWTTADAPANTSQRIPPDVSVAISETPSKAGVCVIGTGQCHLLSWSSDGTIHLNASRESTFNNDREALDASAALVSAEPPASRPVTGDLTKTGPPSITLHRRFVTTVRSSPTGYLEEYVRNGSPDSELVIAAKAEASGYRGVQCTSGQLWVPLVVGDDRWVYVKVKLGTACEAGFFLFRRDAFNLWAFEKFIVQTEDLEFLGGKFSRLNVRPIDLPNPDR